jgi:hypothetical protein
MAYAVIMVTIAGTLVVALVAWAAVREKRAREAEQAQQKS